MRALMACLLVLTAVAGCLDEEPADVPDEPTFDPAPRASGRVPVAPDPSIFEGTVVGSHVTGSQPDQVGHQIGELHTGHHNLELLDHNDLQEGLLQPAGGFTEVHVVNGTAVVSSLTSSRGATLVDVSDPSDMRVLSHIYNLDDNWDARISEDGKYLFLGCQGSGAFDCTGLDTSGENPELTGGIVCTPGVGASTPVSCPGGIAIYDIQEPTAPSFVGYLPMSFTHNVFTFMIDGKYYFVNASGTVAEFDDVNNEYRVASNNITATHDIAVQEHPITGQTILYTGSLGMSLWDMKDPFNPELMSQVDASEYDEPIAPLWHEQTPMPCLIQGRHYTIGAGESGGGVAQPIGVVDTTDPLNPVYVGDWILPDAADLPQPQQNYRFSLHNIDGNCDGQVAVGHYHAGVWVFDISTPERAANPVTLAYYMPHEVAVAPFYSPVVTAPIGALVSADVPNVWTAQWSSDGSVLFIPDMTTGLYALQPMWESN